MNLADFVAFSELRYFGLRACLRMPVAVDQYRCFVFDRHLQLIHSRRFLATQHQFPRDYQRSRQSQWVPADCDGVDSLSQLKFLEFLSYNWWRKSEVGIVKSGVSSM